MRTYLDSSVLIHAVKGADGGSTGVSHRQFNTRQCFSKRRIPHRPG